MPSVLLLLPLLTVAGAAAVDPRYGVAAGVCALPVAVSHLGLWRLYTASGVPAGWSCLYPLGALFVAALLANAGQRAARRAGVSWHGVDYPHQGD